MHRSADGNAAHRVPGEVDQAVERRFEQALERVQGPPLALHTDHICVSHEQNRWAAGSRPRHARDEVVDSPRNLISRADARRLAGKAVGFIFVKPFYTADLFQQMDNIGVGSLGIVFGATIP